jgi:hypothetical protein
MRCVCLCLTSHREYHRTEATVVSVRETAVPNTDLVLRKYEVSYKLQPEDPEVRTPHHTKPPTGS